MKTNYIAILNAIDNLHDVYPNNLELEGDDDLALVDFISVGALDANMTGPETASLLKRSFKVFGEELFSENFSPVETKTKLMSLKRATR